VNDDLGDHRLDHTVPIGAQYHGPPHTGEDEWHRDFPRMRQHGMEFISVWALWGSLELEPAQYRFSGWDHMFDVALGHGIQVLACPTIDMHPHWIHRLFPQAAVLDQRGAPIVSTTGEYGGGVSPGVCLDHPEPRELAVRFLTEFAAHFGDRENLLAWNVWPEQRSTDNLNDLWRSDTSFRMMCFCDRTVEKFRRWLQAKYASLEALSARWRRYYADWADVDAPRLGYWSYGFPEMVDWGEFKLADTTEKLTMRLEAVRKADAGHPVMCHTAGAQVSDTDFCENGIDDWANAGVVDIYGTSFYPKYGGTSRFITPDPVRPSLELDALRSATASHGTALWVSELQAGPALHSPARGNNYSAEDIRLWTLVTLAHGAKAVSWWGWIPEPLGPETLGFGLTTVGGVPTGRAAMAREVARTIKQHEALLAGASPFPAQVAILFNPADSIMNYFGGTGGMPKDIAPASMYGYYKALWENEIPCDVVHVRQMDGLDDYKMLIMPFCFSLTADIAERVRTYVRRGGTVISEAYLGRYREGYIPSPTCPAYGLDEVLRVEALEAEFIEAERIVAAGKQELLRDVDPLTGYEYKEVCTLLDGAEVLATFPDGTAALTRSRVGAGQSLHFGALMGVGYGRADADDRSLGQVLGRLANEAGVTVPATTSSKGGPVKARVLTNGREHALFCLNYGEACEATLRVHLPEPASISDMRTGEAAAWTVAEGGVQLQLSLDARDVRMLRYEELVR
jgi:beta-galactosidase GanA